jgi:hypothetical protein
MNDLRTLPDYRTVFAPRRARLAAGMAAGVAVVPTAPERLRNRDAHYPYRYDSYFYHLSGFAEPGAVLVQFAGASPRSVLFCRDKDIERETWEGFRYGPAAARELFGFDECFSLSELDTRMPQLLADQPALYCHLGDDAQWDARVLGWLNEVRAQARSGVTAPAAIHDLRGLLDEMRPPFRRRRMRAPCARRRGRATSTKSRPNCCTSSAAAAPRRPPTRPSLPPAPTPACCITWPTTRRSGPATCC